MSINGFSDWELHEVSETKQDMWKKGQYICFSEYVEELWVNPRNNKQTIIKKPLQGKMVWVNRNKYKKGV